jgi:hypothetical protein
MPPQIAAINKRIRNPKRVMAKDFIEKIFYKKSFNYHAAFPL